MRETRFVPPPSAFPTISTTLMRSIILTFSSPRYRTLHFHPPTQRQTSPTVPIERAKDASVRHPGTISSPRYAYAPYPVAAFPGPRNRSWPNSTSTRRRVALLNRVGNILQLASVLLSVCMLRSLCSIRDTASAALRSPPSLLLVCHMKLQWTTLHAIDEPTIQPGHMIACAAAVHNCIKTS